jgi:SAM-dependent methyltransferase
VTDAVSVITAADRLNLGCGDDYRRGFHNVDVRVAVDPDEVVDLDDTPWPWADDHFEHVLASNVLEHLDDQLAALEELHRVTAPGGTILAAFPHPASRGQWVDPTHRHPLTPETFEHDVAPAFEVVDVSASRVRFGRVLPERWALWWADHVGHIVDEIQVVLRVPGGDEHGE